MVRSRQNQVPAEFEAFYSPILQLKIQLTSKKKELAAENTVPGFMMLHYSTFTMTKLYQQQDMDYSKIIIIRELIEYILSHDNFKLENEYKSRLCSYIDNLAKELNTSFKAYVYIAMYHGYLDAEIYRCLHPDISIYDFAAAQYVKAETRNSMKNYHDASVKVLEELKLPVNKQSLADRQLKLSKSMGK